MWRPGSFPSKDLFRHRKRFADDSLMQDQEELSDESAEFVAVSPSVSSSCRFKAGLMRSCLNEVDGYYPLFASPLRPSVQPLERASIVMQSARNRPNLMGYLNPQQKLEVAFMARNIGSVYAESETCARSSLRTVFLPAVYDPDFKPSNPVEQPKMPKIVRSVTEYRNLVRSAMRCDAICPPDYVLVFDFNMPRATCHTGRVRKQPQNAVEELIRMPHAVMAQFAHFLHWQTVHPNWPVVVAIQDWFMFRVYHSDAMSRELNGLRTVEVYCPMPHTDPNFWFVWCYRHPFAGDKITPGASPYDCHFHFSTFSTHSTSWGSIFRHRTPAEMRESRRNEYYEFDFDNVLIDDTPFAAPRNKKFQNSYFFSDNRAKALYSLIDVTWRRAVKNCADTQSDLRRVLYFENRNDMESNSSTRKSSQDATGELSNVADEGAKRKHGVKRRGNSFATDDEWSDDEYDRMSSDSHPFNSATCSRGLALTLKRDGQTFDGTTNEFACSTLITASVADDCKTESFSHDLHNASRLTTPTGLLIPASSGISEGSEALKCCPMPSTYGVNESSTVLADEYRTIVKELYGIDDLITLRRLRDLVVQNHPTVAIAGGGEASAERMLEKHVEVRSALQSKLLGSVHCSSESAFTPRGAASADFSNFIGFEDTRLTSSASRSAFESTDAHPSERRLVNVHTTDGYVAELQQQLKSCQAKLKASQQRIDELSQSLASRDAQIAELRQSLAKSEACRADVTNKLCLLQTEMRTLRDSSNAICDQPRLIRSGIGELLVSLDEQTFRTRLLAEFRDYEELSRWLNGVLFYMQPWPGQVCSHANALQRVLAVLFEINGSSAQRHQHVLHQGASLRVTLSTPPCTAVSPSQSSPVNFTEDVKPRVVN